PGGKLEKLINKHFEYDANDKRFPNAICQACRKKLYTAKKHSTVNCHDLKIFEKNPARCSTRADNNLIHYRCECKLCKLVATPLIQPAENGKFLLQRRKKRKPFQNLVRKKVARAVVCRKWCVECKRGTRHRCNKSLLLKNVTSLIRKSKVTDEAITSLLQDKVEENNGLEMRISGTRGGRPTRLSINASQKNSTSDKKFLDSGVKKVFIVGIAPGIQESYTNVSALWSAIDVNSINCTFAVDLKLANIISGLMTHSSAHPCTYCDAPKNELDI
ncbi:hypothetical protein Bhyg_07790, partial [Pseudolycoriella hygida]